MPNITTKVCEKCLGTGRLPVNGPAGIVIRGVSLFCHCHEDEPERYHKYEGDDFDFPMSQHWWDFTKNRLL